MEAEAETMKFKRKLDRHLKETNTQGVELTGLLHDVPDGLNGLFQCCEMEDGRVLPLRGISEPFQTPIKHSTF